MTHCAPHTTVTPLACVVLFSTTSNAFKSFDWPSSITCMSHDQTSSCMREST